MGITDNKRNGNIQRMHTKTVQIGDRIIGGGHPILIQSMTNTKTEDVEATVRQILELEAAGCDIIRCAVPTMEAAKALKEIKKQIHIPLVADIHFEKAQDYAERFHTKPYASLEEMIEKEQPDVLHVCTPHYLHVPMTQYALERGINVFMEKPPAITLAQLDQLKQAVYASKAKLGLCYQNRYNPSYRAAKEFIASGAAGKVLGARGLVTWNRPAPYYTQSEWRGKLATEGGGVLINQAVHTLDLLSDLLGKPDWIDASLSNHHLKGLIEVEDTLEAYIRFGEKVACFYATNAYCADVPPLIEISCEKVTVRIEDLDVSYRYPDGTITKPDVERPVPIGKSYWGSGHTAYIGDFYKALENNTDFALELPVLENSIRLMLGAYESAREHHVVEFS